MSAHPSVPTIFSARRRAARQRRAMTRQQRSEAAQWLRQAMAEDVLERLEFLRWEGREALVAGDWAGVVGAHLAAKGVSVDAREALALDRPIEGGPFDLIVTLAELDTINDLPGALVLLRRALAPGGLLLAMIPGAGSLPGLRAIMLTADGERPSARIHPQIDALAASGLLQRAGFARQAVDHFDLTVRYGTLATLVDDLRDQALGAALADAGPVLSRAACHAAEQAFDARRESDGKVSETFAIIALTAWQA